MCNNERNSLSNLCLLFRISQIPRGGYWIMMPANRLMSDTFRDRVNQWSLPIVVQWQTLVNVTISLNAWKFLALVLYETFKMVLVEWLVHGSNRTCHFKMAKKFQQPKQQVARRREIMLFLMSWSYRQEVQKFWCSTTSNDPWSRLPNLKIVAVVLPQNPRCYIWADRGRAILNFSWSSQI